MFNPAIKSIIFVAMHSRHEATYLMIGAGVRLLPVPFTRVPPCLSMTTLTATNRRLWEKLCMHIVAAVQMPNQIAWWKLFGIQTSVTSCLPTTSRVNQPLAPALGSSSRNE